MADDYNSLKSRMNQRAMDATSGAMDMLRSAPPPRPRTDVPGFEAPAPAPAPTQSTGPLDLADLSVEQMKSIRPVADLLKQRGAITDAVYQAVQNPPGQDEPQGR
jgi:hypothetical protein